MIKANPDSEVGSDVQGAKWEYSGYRDERFERFEKVCTIGICVGTEVRWTILGAYRIDSRYGVGNQRRVFG